jgi:hypothetical protein
MPHTLASRSFVYDHPEARAADLMAALADPTIKAVFSCIGGDDTIRLMPYIDFDVIRNNPKLSSIYGPAIQDVNNPHLYLLETDGEPIADFELGEQVYGLKAIGRCVYLFGRELLFRLENGDFESYPISRLTTSLSF